MMRSSRSRAKYAHAAGLGARRPRFRYIRVDRISLSHEVYSLAVVPVVVSPACQQAAQGHRARVVCPVGTERRTNGGSASHATSGDCRTAQEGGDWVEEFDHEDAGQAHRGVREVSRACRLPLHEIVWGMTERPRKSGCPTVQICCTLGQ